MQILEEVTINTELGDIFMYIAFGGAFIMMVGFLVSGFSYFELNALFFIGAVVALVGALIMGMGNVLGIETQKDVYKAYVDDAKVLEEKGYRILEHKQDDIYIVEKLEDTSK